MDGSNRGRASKQTGISVPETPCLTDQSELVILAYPQAPPPLCQNF